MGSIITLEDNVGLIYNKAAEKVHPCTVTLYIPSEKRKRRGVWYIHDSFVQNHDNIIPMLSSILIEYHPSYRTIVSTKFEVFIPILKGLTTTKTL